jgi:hypothetical protein
MDTVPCTIFPSPCNEFLVHVGMESVGKGLQAGWNASPVNSLSATFVRVLVSFKEARLACSTNANALPLGWILDPVPSTHSKGDSVTSRFRSLAEKWRHEWQPRGYLQDLVLNKKDYQDLDAASKDDDMSTDLSFFPPGLLSLGSITMSS